VFTALRVIPVMDLKAGRLVHAVAGDRARYQPLESVFHPRPDPVDLARGMRDQLSMREVYLADLDAIEGEPPAASLYRDLAELGLSCWVDAGLNNGHSLAPLLHCRIHSYVAGLESLDGPLALAAILDQVGPDHLVFSLDLRQGRPLISRNANWGTHEPVAIAQKVVDLGVRRILLLDLAHVGMGAGTGTSTLQQELASWRAGLELTVGGGLTTVRQLAEVERAGASAALVGSALHDGRISPEHLKALRDGFDPDGKPR